MEKFWNFDELLVIGELLEMIMYSRQARSYFTVIIVVVVIVMVVSIYQYSVLLDHL